MEWRYAKDEDVNLLAELNHQLIADEGHRNPMDVAQLAGRLRDWIHSEYRAVLFSDDVETVGYALFRTDETARVHLRQFFVVRHRRRQGLGRQALAAFRDEIAPPDMSIVLEVLAANAAGRSFWVATGFQEYATTFELLPRAASAG